MDNDSYIPTYSNRRKIGVPDRFKLVKAQSWMEWIHRKIEYRCLDSFLFSGGKSGQTRGKSV